MTPLAGDRLQPAWLMYIDSSPAVRIWTGAANFKLGPCGQDAGGGLYLGLGILVTVPSLKIPLNGGFSQHTFSLSGVSKTAMAAVNADRTALRGARVGFARLELDADGNPVAAPVWVWIGFVNGIRMTRNGQTRPPTRMVSLLCATGSPRRLLRAYGYYTSVQQRLIDPADSSCDFTAYYAAGTDEIWPI